MLAETDRHHYHLSSLHKSSLVSFLLSLVFVSLTNAQTDSVKPLLRMENTEEDGPPAALSGALYVDPWSIEKEILLVPTLLNHWLETDFLPDTLLTPEKRQELRPLISTYFHDKLATTYDGQKLTFHPIQVRFIKPITSELILIPDEATVPASEIVISLTYSAALPRPQGLISLTWDLFPADLHTIDLLVADDIGTRTFPLTPENQKIEFTPRLVQGSDQIPLPPVILNSHILHIPWLSILLAIPIIILILKTIRAEKLPVSRLALMLALVAAAAVAQKFVTLEVYNPLTASKTVTNSEGKLITSDLLRNVYHAFDFRDEEQQYELLQRVTDGKTLTQVYLEARRTLLEREKNGSRVIVTSLTVENARVTEYSLREGFSALTTWTTRGRVGHWGHFHERVNSYQAELRITPRDGIWKLTALKLLSADRQQ